MLRVAEVRISSFRNLRGFELELASGITGVHGPNGAGKTNLLEAIYFALTGRSFRTSDRREMIPFGESIARVEATVADGRGVSATFMAAVSRTEGRRYLLDGKPAERTDAARRRPHLLVFSPDRLSIVKGPPAERRAHIDVLGEALRPHAAGLRRAYGQALAQRNAMLSRVAAGHAEATDLEAWDRTLARAATELMAARARSIEALSPELAEAGSEIGLPGEASIGYRPRATGGEPEIAEELARRRESDISNRRTGWGPHLDEVELALDGRSVRRYGSQGQQRGALLALLLAERRLLELSHVTPLMLLDDVMSELDPPRRDLLGRRLAGAGQSMITTADGGLLPSSHLADVIELRGQGDAG